MFQINKYHAHVLLSLLSHFSRFFVDEISENIFFPQIILVRTNQKNLWAEENCEIKRAKKHISIWLKINIVLWDFCVCRPHKFTKHLRENGLFYRIKTSRRFENATNNISWVAALRLAWSNFKLPKNINRRKYNSAYKMLHYNHLLTTFVVCDDDDDDAVESKWDGKSGSPLRVGELKKLKIVLHYRLWIWMAMRRCKHLSFGRWRIRGDGEKKKHFASSKKISGHLTLPLTK